MAMRRFGSDRGQSLVIFLLVLPVLILVAGMVIDGGNAFAHKRQIQNAADASALAAVQDLDLPLACTTDFCREGYRDGVRDRAQEYSLSNGQTGALHRCTDRDLTTGFPNGDPEDFNCYTWPYKGSWAKVEVKLKRPAAGFFTQFLGLAVDYFKPAARAVAALGSTSVPHCSLGDVYLPTCTIPGTPIVGNVQLGTGAHCDFTGVTPPPPAPWDQYLTNDPPCSVPGTDIVGTYQVTPGHCEFFPPVENPDQYYGTGCLIPGSPGANPAIIFSRSTSCDALKIHNAGPGNGLSLFRGALVSNGGYDFDHGVHGDLLRYREPSTTCHKLAIGDAYSGAWNGLLSGWPDTIERIPDSECGSLPAPPAACKDWLVPNPTVAPCQGCAPAVPSGSMSNWWVQERGSNGGIVVAEKLCRDVGTTVSETEIRAHPGTAYCNAVSLKATKPAYSFTDPAGVAFVAPKVVIETGVKLVPLTALYVHGSPGACGRIGGLFIYAWDNATSAVDMKGDNHWGGGMFVPTGGVSITGVDSVASEGYIQAGFKIDYGSGAATFNGTGNCQSPGTAAVQGTLVPPASHCVFDPPVASPDDYLPDCVIPGTGQQGAFVSAADSHCDFTGVSPAPPPPWDQYLTNTPPCTIPGTDTVGTVTSTVTPGDPSMDE